MLENDVDTVKMSETDVAILVRISELMLPRLLVWPRIQWDSHD